MFRFHRSAILIAVTALTLLAGCDDDGSSPAIIQGEFDRDMAEDMAPLVRNHNWNHLINSRTLTVAPPDEFVWSETDSSWTYDDTGTIDGDSFDILVVIRYMTPLGIPVMTPELAGYALVEVEFHVDYGASTESGILTMTDHAVFTIDDLTAGSFTMTGSGSMLFDVRRSAPSVRATLFMPWTTDGPVSWIEDSCPQGSIDYDLSPFSITVEYADGVLESRLFEDGVLVPESNEAFVITDCSPDSLTVLTIPR